MMREAIREFRKEGFFTASLRHLTDACETGSFSGFSSDNSLTAGTTPSTPVRPLGCHRDAPCAIRRQQCHCSSIPAQSSAPLSFRIRTMMVVILLIHFPGRLQSAISCHSAILTWQLCQGQRCRCYCCRCRPSLFVIKYATYYPS